MMNYYYDMFGNVTTNADPQRTTVLVPPVCPNGQQPNWTGSGWMCIVFAAPAALPAPTLGTKITPLAYTKRIGQTALNAIYGAAQSSPPLQVFIAQTWGSKFIDLTDPLTATGLNALVGASILTAAQVTSILSTPATQSEIA